MAVSKADIDELDLAIASGELTVKINGREITYRSIGELIKARRHIASVIAKQGGIRKNPLSGINPMTDRGL
ncbi:hypothetical protein [Pseudoalteromonas sp. MMG024]|uniref:phage head-tail joining protein n=1 Tax=Pseudoalteromonas sp. MMG024 TaxID=2909980 RepID=UPI001F405491|nr:hypothetical protein [Pseudoalteromonas sp. MMG024]MCF6459052.1 hypothetical protein [Pseudoalteromonas sp. MMG024]